MWIENSLIIDELCNNKHNITMMFIGMLLPNTSRMNQETSMDMMIGMPLGTVHVYVPILSGVAYRRGSTGISPSSLSSPPTNNL